MQVSFRESIRIIIGSTLTQLSLLKGWYFPSALDDNLPSPTIHLTTLALRQERTGTNYLILLSLVKKFLISGE